MMCNIHFFIWCETLTHTWHTDDISWKCEYITWFRIAPPLSKVLSSKYTCTTVGAISTKHVGWPLHFQNDFQYNNSIETISFDTIVGSKNRISGIRHQILTKNFKILNLRVISFIWYSNICFSIQYKTLTHIWHTKTMWTRLNLVKMDYCQ